MKLSLNIHEAVKMAKAVSFAMSKGDVCINLKGALFEYDGKQSLKLVSTDRHRMSIYTTEVLGGDTAESFIAPYDAIIWITKIKPARNDNRMVTIERDGINITLSDEINTSRFQAIDMNFPDYKRVIPNIKPDATYVKIQAQYLIDVCKAALAVSNSGETSVILRFNDSNSPVAIETQANDNLRIVQMPMRL